MLNLTGFKNLSGLNYGFCDRLILESSKAVQLKIIRFRSVLLN